MIKSIFNKLFIIIAILFTMIISFNFIFIPRGIQLANILPLPMEVNADKNIISHVFLFKKLSFFIFKKTGVYCDAPSYDSNLNIFENRGGTLVMLMNSYDLQNDPFTLKEIIFALQNCDLNKAAEADGLTALQRTIILKNTKLAKLVLNNGGDPSVKTSFPGKPFDSLSPVEFVEFIKKKKTTSESELDELSKIEELIERQSIQSAF